jgi:hypothetical protein
MDAIDFWPDETPINTAEGPVPVKPPSYQARGAASPFDDGKYNIGQTSYPKDLLANPQYGGNYVIFYINVNQESMLINGDNAAPTVTGNIPNINSELRTAGFDQKAYYAAAALVGGITGAASLSDIAGKVTSGVGVDITNTAKSVVGAAAGGIAAIAAVATIGTKSSQYKQLKQAIALHLPTDLSIRYGMQWEETDLAGTTAILAGAENLGSALKEGLLAAFTEEGSIADAADKLKAAGGGAANYLSAQGLRIPGIGEAISKFTNTAANPKKEQLFKQVDFRTFTFSYQFFPKSAQESKNVQDIIKAFKLHMHPEFKPNSYNFMYIYPSEFDIYYYHNGKENLNLHRHPSCVLTDMSVVYAPQGIVTMFPDGSPTQINVTLTFKELAILTKENIQDGF